MMMGMPLLFRLCYHNINGHMSAVILAKGVGLCDGCDYQVQALSFIHDHKNSKV